MEKKKKQENWTPAANRLARGGQFLSDRAFRLNVILDSYSEPKYVPGVDKLAFMLGCSPASLKKALAELHGKRIKKVSSGYARRNKNTYVSFPPEKWELRIQTEAMTKKRRGFMGKSQRRKGRKMPVRPPEELLHSMKDDSSLNGVVDTSLNGVLNTPLSEEVLDQDPEHLIRSVGDASRQRCPSDMIEENGGEKGGLPAPIITVLKPLSSKTNGPKYEIPSETQSYLDELKREESRA